jgi:hypothetical protein
MSSVGTVEEGKAIEPTGSAKRKGKQRKRRTPAKFQLLESVNLYFEFQISFSLVEIHLRLWM